MAEILGKTENISFTVNILIKKDDNCFVAHCLELDIVAAADSPRQAQRDVISLICAQIDYAFNNDNIENLYHPAPREIWSQFFSCKDQTERKYKVDSTFPKKQNNQTAIPPWLISKTCQTNYSSHV